MNRLKRFLSLCCVMALLIGTYPATVLATADEEQNGGDAVDMIGNNSDIAVMTFNILADNSGSTKYDTPANRLPRIVKTIQNYSPDVFGVQEASNYYYLDAARTLSWHQALADEMAKLGYANTSYHEESGKDANVQAGLMMFYKTDRFSFNPSVQDHGYESITTTGTYDGVTAQHPYGRYYHYIQLIDTYHNNQPVYFFNTHFGLDVSKDTSGNAVTGNTALMISRQIRTKQAVQLATAVKAKAENLPFFVFGDFNTTLAEAYPDKYHTTAAATGYNQLAAIPQTFSSMQPAIRVAHRITRAYPFDAEAWDGIYVNNSNTIVTDFMTALENVDGRRPSDHSPMIAYAKYAPAISSVSTGTYDKWKNTYEATTASNSFTLNITPAGSNFTFKLGDNAIGNNTLTLTKSVNQFDISVYNNGNLYTVIPATVKYTAAAKPTLTAGGALNTYFSKGAYHVALAKDAASVTLSLSGGTLYADSSCTVSASTTLTDITPGRTTYYIKSTATDDIYPLYILKATGSADTSAKVLYVDDDFTDVTGTAAFYNGKDVLPITVGTNGFADIKDVLATVNTADGYTVYVGTGNYSTDSVKINKAVSFIGSNADVAANTVDAEGGWSVNKNRYPESVLTDALVYNFTTAATGNDAKVTVKGFTFEGQVQLGNIYIIENRGVTATTTFDVQNNIFAGSCYTWNGAAIFSNDAAHKSGTISGNYFATVGNLVKSYAASTDKESDYYRGIFMRNPDGLVLDGNRFSGYEIPLWLSAELQSGDKTRWGNANYTVQNCLFEDCDRTENYIYNVGSDSSANVKYLNNRFVNCAYTTPALYFNFNETGLTTDFSKVSLEIRGNDFEDCLRSIKLERNTYKGDMTLMKLHITENRFLNPTETHEQVRKLKYTLWFYMYVKNNSTSNVILPENADWDLSHNYFCSDFLVKGDSDVVGKNNYTVTAVNDPVHFIDDGNSFVLNEMYMPYYTNAEKTRLCYKDGQPDVDAAQLYDIESEIRWMGRTFKNDDVHYFNWSNSGFEFSFTGTGAEATLHSNNPDSTNTAYVVVYVDGKKTQTIPLNFTKQNVVLATGLSNKKHTIKVIKRTNGRSSTAGLSYLWLENDGVKETPPAASCRKMLMIGDSITVGYGTLGNSSTTAWSTATEDGTITYAAKTADYFSAENQTIAISGRGIVRNTDQSTTLLMPEIVQWVDYNQQTAYDFGQYTPDVIVINLGTNDTSGGSGEQATAAFKTGCKSFLQQIRGYYPNAKIIYAYGAMTTTYAAQVQECVTEMNDAGDANVCFLPLTTQSDRVLGHPSATAHQSLSEELIAKVAEITGWTKGESHIWDNGTQIKAPTCTEAGSKKYVCTVCSTEKIESIPATGHDWEDDFTIDVQPGELTAGSKSIHCKNCDAKKDVTAIPATLTGFEIVQTVFDYDGSPKSAVINIPNESTISYSTDGETYTAEAPTLTDVGTLTVYFKLERADHDPLFGSFVLTVKDPAAGLVRVYGYKGSVENGPQSVRVEGTLEGDQVTYSVNGKDFVSQNPSFNSVGTHKVWVKITRDGTDTLYIASVILTNQPAQSLFTLSLGRGLTQGADGKYESYWEVNLDPTGAIDYATEDIKVLDYGIKYADDALTLEKYGNARLFGGDTGSLKMKTYSYAASETGLSRVYKTYSFRIAGINPGKVRSAMAYIQYEYNGVVYEEFSAVDVTTTILDGLIGGIGDTIESDDTLDD